MRYHSYSPAKPGTLASNTGLQPTGGRKGIWSLRVTRNASQSNTFP
jgi:hypothetical protein